MRGPHCPAGMPGWPPSLLLWALLPPGPHCAMMAVQRGYTILIVPLGTALSSLEALRFFFWVSLSAAQVAGTTTTHTNIHTPLFWPPLDLTSSPDIQCFEVLKKNL